MSNMFNNEVTIKKYILGEDTFPFDVELLEDDPLFMLEVLKHSRDPKMYNFTSKRVRTDYEFVKGVIETFKDKPAFIKKVADNYIATTKDFITLIEILIIASECFDKDLDAFFEYRVRLEAITAEVEIYESLRADIEINELGYFNSVGFSETLERFAENETCLDFFARKAIQKIFSTNEINLEKFLHSSYESEKLIRRYGTRDIMIRFLSGFDECLSDYVTTHIYLIDDYSKDIEKIIKRWPRYIETQKKNRIEAMCERVLEYIDLVDTFFYDVKEVIEYIGKELGISEDLNRYMPSWLQVDEDSDYLPIECQDDEHYVDYPLECYSQEFERSQLSLSDYKHYLNIKKIMRMSLRGFTEEKFLSFIDDLKKSKKVSRKKDESGKIIKFRPMQ